MSREIGFRAYQKTPSLNHKPGLYEVTGLDFYEGDYGGGEVCLRNKKGEQWTEYIKDVVLEQYTGLKDKNGEEIYEGDIVEEDIDFNSKITDGTFRYKVYWNEDELCWSLDPIGPESIHNDLWELNSSCRVIGNVHENKELLDGSN